MKIDPREYNLKKNARVVLRSPRPEEAERVLDYLRKFVRESSRNLNTGPNHFDNYPVEKERKYLEDLELSDSGFMLAAYSGDQIIGTLTLSRAPGEYTRGTGRIGMGLLASHHGLGVGTALMESAFETARQMGFHRAELTVRTFNAPAIALYEKVGMRRVGTLTHAALIEGEYFDEYMYEIVFSGD